MAGIVGIRQSAWNAASPPQRAVARMIFNRLELGTPASGTIAGQAWFVWADHRIDQTFVENLAWCMSHLTDFDDAPIRDYAVPVDADPLTVAADANNGVAWFTARQSLPAGWTPDDGEE